MSTENENAGPDPASIIQNDNSNAWTDETAFLNAMKSSPESYQTDPESTPEEKPEGQGAEKEQELPELYKGLPGAELIFGKQNAPAESEAADGEKPAEGQEAGEATESDYASLQQFLPGYNVRNREDLEQVAKELIEKRNTLERFDELAGGSAELQAVLQGLTAGRDFSEIVGELGFSEQVPDKQADPEAYADYMVSKKMRDQRAAERKAAVDKRNDTIANRNRNIEKSYGSFIQRAGLDGEQLQATEKEMQTFVNGQALERGDYFDIIHFGLNREAMLEAAKASGRAEVIAEMKAGKTPNLESNSKQRSFAKQLPLPHTQSQKEIVEPNLSDKDKEILHLQKSFSGDGELGSILGDF